MPMIGDDHLTVKQYQALRERYREANTSKSWTAWARHYMSPTGARDRNLVAEHERYEASTKTAFHAQNKAQRQNMAAEWDPIQAQDEAIRQSERNAARTANPLLEMS